MEKMTAEQERKTHKKAEIESLQKKTKGGIYDV